MSEKYEQDVVLVKELIHTHPWRQGADQHQKWVEAAKQLCQLHNVTNITAINLVDDEIPHYDPITKTITINKYSIITMLHELGHHFGWGHTGEPNCFDWSEAVFKAAYPIARDGLVRDDRHYLVTPPDNGVRKLYFAYGVNLNKSVMLSRCAGSEPVVLAILNDYDIKFTGHSRNWNGGVATLVATPGAKVTGALYNVPECCFYKLDGYEGGLVKYDRRLANVVRLDTGETAEAFVYFKIAELEETEPSEAYKIALGVGRREWGIETVDPPALGV